MRAHQNGSLENGERALAESIGESLFNTLMLEPWPSPMTTRKNK